LDAALSKDAQDAAESDAVSDVLTLWLEGKRVSMAQSYDGEDSLLMIAVDLAHRIEEGL